MHGLLRHLNADLLHNPVYLACRTSLPQIATIHDTFALQFPWLCKRLNRWHYQRRLPRTLRDCAGIITPTAFVRDCLLRYYTDNSLNEELRRKTSVIPWGIDDIFYQSDRAQATAMRAKYNLPEKYVLYVGRQEPKKNSAAVMKAFFAACCSSGAQHALVCVGPRGWGGNDLEGTAHRLAFSERLVRCGFVPREDLPGLYAGASLLLFPSYVEGFGLPVLEAMACGTPVIASSIPPFMETARGAAVLCPADDLAGMRIAIEQIISDPEFAQGLQSRGRDRAEQYRWDAHARLTLDCYRQIAGRKEYHFMQTVLSDTENPL